MKSNNRHNDVTIIGNGIIGSFIAYYLTKSNKKLKITILEKNPYSFFETSSRNSGVIHGGFDPKSNSNEAKYNILGAAIYKNEIFKDFDFPHKKVASIILAFNKTDEEELKMLYKRGKTNGVDLKHLKLISAEKVFELEPHVNKKVKLGLIYDDSYLIDPLMLGLELNNHNKKENVQILNNFEVTNVMQSDGLYKIESKDGRYIKTKYVINAAGVYGDLINYMLSPAEKDKYEIVQRRGTYLILNKQEAHKVNNILFLTPNKHGKGVIVAPMLTGQVLTGPTAEEGISKEDTNVINFNNFKKIRKNAHKIIPSLSKQKIELIVSGSRAILKQTNDFLIGEKENFDNFINVIGMQSPGLTAAPAIGKEIAHLINKKEKKGK